ASRVSCTFLVYMLSPLPRRSGWAYCFAQSPSRISLPRKGCRVGLRIVLFEACSAFTRVTASTLAPSPIRDTHSQGFSYFVTSIAAPVASGWSGRRVGLTPTGKRRLLTAHTLSRPAFDFMLQWKKAHWLHGGDLMTFELSVNGHSWRVASVAEFRRAL